MRYTKQEIIEKIEEKIKNNNVKELYQLECINYSSLTKDTEEKCSEVIAEYINNHMEFWDTIEVLRRNSSYKVENHDGTTEKEISNREEERIALAMYGKEYDCIGKVIDYQVPLKNVRNDSVGKIDMISTIDNTVYLLELKRKSNTENLLRCALEIYTYYKTVDTEKLLEDFAYANYNIIPAILVFEESKQYNEYKDKMGSKEVLKLMETLNIKIFFLSETENNEYAVKSL